MGNSPSASAAAAAAAPNAPAAASAPNALLSTDSKKNNSKTVIQVPAENVTISKGGKHRRLRGGVASVRFNMNSFTKQVNSAPSGALIKGGKRRRTHKRKSRRRHHRK